MYDQQVTALMRAAGSCPIAESTAEESDCRKVFRLGLEWVGQAPARKRWVTALGWGNPEADLLIVGNNPHYPKRAVDDAGPNWETEPSADREAKAEKFPSDFLDFVEKQWSTGVLSPTTIAQYELALLWAKRFGKSAREAVFVSELVLCPQRGDSVISEAELAYKTCFGRHLDALLRITTKPPKVVVVHGRETVRSFGLLYLSARGIANGPKVETPPDFPDPAQNSPIEVRAADNRIPFHVVGTLAPVPRVWGRTGTNWADAVLSAIDGLGTDALLA